MRRSSLHRKHCGDNCRQKTGGIGWSRTSTHPLNKRPLNQLSFDPKKCRSRYPGSGRVGRAFTQLRSARYARAKSAKTGNQRVRRTTSSTGVARSRGPERRRCSDRDHPAGTPRACLFPAQPRQGEARSLPGPGRCRRVVSTDAGSDVECPTGHLHRMELNCQRPRILSSHPNLMKRARVQDARTFETDETPEKNKGPSGIPWMALLHTDLQ